MTPQELEICEEQASKGFSAAELTRSAHPATGGTPPERKSAIANSVLRGKRD